MRVISFINDPAVLRRNAEHPGLWPANTRLAPKAHSPPGPSSRLDSSLSQLPLPAKTSSTNSRPRSGIMETAPALARLGSRRIRLSGFRLLGLHSTSTQPPYFIRAPPHDPGPLLSRHRFRFTPTSCALFWFPYDDALRYSLRPFSSRCNFLSVIRPVPDERPTPAGVGPLGHAIRLSLRFRLFAFRPSSSPCFLPLFRTPLIHVRKSRIMSFDALREERPCPK